MSLTVEGLPDLVTWTVRARERFIRRLFLKPSPDLDVSSWEHTAFQHARADIAKMFHATREEFLAFLNDPTKEMFNKWNNELRDLLDEAGVGDDWNASTVFLSIVTTKYRDFNTIVGPIKPFDNVEDVRDESFADPNYAICPRAFATFVLAIASVANFEPTMEQVADSLLSEAHDGEESDEDEEDDE